MDSPSPGERPEATDAELVRLAATGEPWAFEQLVRRYQGLLVARAYAILEDRGEAEDAAQTAFLRAYRALGQLREPQAFAAWLLATVANVARRAATKRARRPANVADIDAGHRPRRHEEVIEAVASLPEADQQVIHLFYHQGHTCAEIARMLDLQVGSVTSRLTRARQKLRDLLRRDQP
ncbi:MAG: RNA polymerase sigma factor [Candidatus Brocadiia bacterium]